MRIRSRCKQGPASNNPSRITSRTMGAEHAVCRGSSSYGVSVFRTVSPESTGGLPSSRSLILLTTIIRGGESSKRMQEVPTMEGIESARQEDQHVCFRCGGVIEIGEKMVTLSVAVETPIGDEAVEVLEANAISTLCPACASTTDSSRQYRRRLTCAAALTSPWRPKSGWCRWNSLESLLQGPVVGGNHLGFFGAVCRQWQTFLGPCSRPGCIW